MNLFHPFPRRDSQDLVPALLVSIPPFPFPASVSEYAPPPSDPLPSVMRFLANSPFTSPCRADGRTMGLCSYCVFLSPFFFLKLSFPFPVLHGVSSYSMTTGAPLGGDALFSCQLNPNNTKCPQPLECRSFSNPLPLPFPWTPSFLLDGAISACLLEAIPQYSPRWATPGCNDISLRRH